MQHTCARRPLAFALASLTTLTTISALSGPPAVIACSPPPTFSETLSMSEIIVTGSIGEIEKKSLQLDEERYEISIATVHIADVLKGAVTRGQSLRVSHIDASDFEQVINGESVETDATVDPIPLSMKTGLFLISGPHAEDPDSPALYSSNRVYDITEGPARDGLVPIVREHVALDAIADPVRQRTALFEWIVKCAENPMTRRDGFYEFSRVDDERIWRMQSEDQQDREHAFAKIMFTDGQIDRLTTVWLDSLEKRDESAMWFGNALGDHRGELVATRLLDAIAADGDGDVSHVGTWMSTVASVYKWRSGQLLAQKMWESEDPVERAGIVKRFLELAPLRAEIPEALVPEEEEVTESVDDVESTAVTEMEEVEREAVEGIEQVGVEEEVVEDELEQIEIGNTGFVFIGRTLRNQPMLNKR